MSDSKWQQGSDDEEFFCKNKQDDSSSDSDEVRDVKTDSGDSEEPSDNEDTNLSFEEKVKRLQEQFKAIPPLMIKKVLQRDDVKGDLRTALECLKTMSKKGSPNVGMQGKTNRASESSNGKKQKPQKIRKEYEGNHNSGKCESESDSVMRERSDIEEATGADNKSESRRHENLSGLVNDELFFEDTENDDGENLSLEDKVKILQQRFKGFPPFAIRKILQRQDVKEDLEKAYECLESISPLKGTFKEGEGDKEKASKEQKPRRKALGQEKEKAKGNQGENPSGITDEERSEHGEEGAVGGRGGAEDNAAKTNPQKKKRNNRARNRKNKIQVQDKGGNERNNENMERPGPPKSWQGGYQHQQWEHGGYMQQPQWQGEYPQQPWGQGGYSQQPRGRSGFNPGGPPQGRERHFRGGNQRCYPRGDGRDYQRGHPGNYYHGAPNVGPHQWDGYDRGQRADYSYYEGFPPPPAGGFKRAQSDVDIRMNRGQPRPRRNSTEKENPNANANANANAQNRQSRGGHRWAGRGAGRGTGQRQTAESQNVQSQIEIQNLEPNMIVIRGLKTSTTSDAIRNFVEARSGEEVLDIAKMDEGNALVTLQKLSEFENAKQKMESRTMEGSKVTIHRVPVSSSILVRNISSDTTHDALEFYFCNQRIGGEVTSIQYEKGSSQAVVTFKDPDVMHKVLSSKSLKLNEAKLTVERFNPMFQESGQGLHSKEEIAVAVDKNMMEFTTTHSLDVLKNSLSVLGFTVKYTSGDSIVYIVPITRGENQANKEKGIKAVTDFFKTFKTIELDVEQDHWVAVMSEISKLHKDIGKDKVSVKEAESSKYKITIICPISESQHIIRKFSEKIEETQSLEVKKTYERQKMIIEEEKLALLNKIGFKEKYFSEYDKLEVDIDQDNGTITIFGPKKQYSEAKIEIYKHLSKMSERTISLPQTVYEMLSTEEGLERIKTELRRKNLDAVFCIDEDNEEKNTASVVGINKKHADEAADLIKSLTSEIKIKVERDMMEVLRTQEWRDLCDEVRQLFKVYVRINEYSDTWIAGFKGDVSSAHDRIQTFLDDNSIGTETFCCLDKGVRRYIMEHRKEEITKMESTLKRYSVKISAGATADAFSISGTKIGIGRLQEALDLLTSSVVMNEMQVQQPGLQKFVSTERGGRLVKSVEHEHKCAIEKVGNASRKTTHKPPSPDLHVQRSDGSLDTSSESDDEDDATAQAYSVRTPNVVTGSMSMTCGNVRISWKQGNIEAQNVDVLVGSTIGQLSAVFQKAGVPVVKQHSGTVSAVSQCGNLPCKRVILTTCCKWDGGNGAAEMELRSIVRQCLQASQLNASSIAFPIIGTGGLGFPNNTACKTMINEVINVTSGWGTSSLNDISFAVFAQDAQLINAFQQEFTLASGSTSAQSQIPVPSSTTAKVFGNVSVQVLQGDLVQQNTDAIVNINGTDMNMQNAGALSKAVAAAAGQSVQDECTGLGQQTPGSAVVTSAGNLQANHIIHGIPGKADVQHIQTCIEKCLQVADSYQFRSISMPAFGTGSYGMTDYDSAEATFQALANVCANLQNLKQVRTVIFQPKMLSTFHQTLQQYLTKSFKQSKPRKPPAADKATKHSPNSKKSVNMNGAMKPIQFRLFGKSKGCVDIAQTVLTKGFTEVCKTHAVDNEDASKLSERQRKKLTTKAKHLDVTIKFEDRIGRIVVRGDPEDVTAITNDIWEEIQERTNKEREKEQAEVLYKTIKWQYELHGTRKYFHKIPNAAIEKAHANDNNRVSVEVQGENFVIVFATSTGTGSSTGHTMSVKRTSGSSGHGEGIALPKEWSPMPSDSSGVEATVHLVSLTQGSAEYQKVQSMFQTTGGKGQIIRIERIQNPHLYQQYVVRKQKMDRDNKGINNERQLFHGTADKNVTDINTKGFNRSYCGVHGVAYGKGVYFARDASYSAGYAQDTGISRNPLLGFIHGGQSGGKPMYLARVLTGKYAQGNPGMIVPPKGYDSVANCTSAGAGIFVVFYDAQCYPDYLITFQ